MHSNFKETAIRRVLLGTLICLAAVSIGLAQRPEAKRSTLRTAAITLTQYGFDPQEITLVAGPTLFVVYNHSGADEVDLRLEQKQTRGEGLEINREKVDRSRSRWINEVNLQRGVYRVTDLNRPEIFCDVTVE